MGKSNSRGFVFVIFLSLFLALMFLLYSFMMGNAEKYGHKDFIKDAGNNNVSEVHIKPDKVPPTGKVQVELSDGTVKSFYVTNVENFENEVSKYAFTVVVEAAQKDNVFLTSILPDLILFAVMLFFFMAVTGSQNGGGSKMMNFGKSPARMVLGEDGKKITLADVAGIDEEKEELSEIVEFLKNPEKFVRVGAKIPKGVLLSGPPGTGKTLLAKAIAGEADVPFFTISGSDFEEMFVGVGASRVRDLFAEAKKHAPCIIFIDEIDAVAKKRGIGVGSGPDEHNHTLNQMLVEMDGFSKNEGIIVLAATNRIDILDPAILRPGRFDRKVFINRPDVKGREDILNIHAKNKPLGEDVNLKDVAKLTSGYTGADLENLLNEAAIMAAKQEKSFIRQEDINKAMIKTNVGVEKKSHVVSEEDKKITAYHEAGHAILHHMLPKTGEVYAVSIIPTGDSAAGYTMPIREDGLSHMTKGRLYEEIIVYFGGRVAEQLVLDDITTGASEDIRQATNIAREMVTKYGFSDTVGPINCDIYDDRMSNRGYVYSREFGENVANTIDKEVKKIIDEAYTKATEMIKANREILDKCAALLIEKERIGKDEFESLF